MSVKVVHEEIKRFLGNSTPEVLCLKGKWGVGKTYAWNFYLQEASDNGKLALDKYAYVSLFGLKSLEDVKYALFEGTVSKNELKEGPTPNSLESAYKWVKRNYRKGTSFIANNPLVKSYIGETERSLFFLVRNQIVCIDDLERAGGDLNTKDIFGLVSYLKEQRGCKVVLLLNDEKLSEENKSTYTEQLEKVVDTRLDFSPTPEEAADIAFPTLEGVRAMMHKNCVTLGITNIRVLKKIERIVLRFQEIFGENSPLMHQVTNSACLFGWMVYQPEEAPTLDFLMDGARFYGLNMDKKPVPPNDLKWQELMRKYEYRETDEFDLKILETIQKGYFDVDSLKKVAESQLARLEEHKADNDFSGAWDLYRDSFDDNEKEMLTKLYSSAKQGIKKINPANMDAAIVFLKEFGKNKEAKDLIKSYIENRGGEKEVINFEDSFFNRDIKDPDFLAALKKSRKKFEGTRDPVKTLIDISINSGWNPEDIALISRLTTNDFYKIFKETKGGDLHRVLKTSLSMGTYGSASDEMKKITKNATTALKRIAKESELNRRRVAGRINLNN